MAAAATIPVAFTPAELTFLGALLGAEVLPGVPDPFFGVLADEADEGLVAAKASLIARRILEERESGPPVVNLSVALMLGALCFPQASLRLTLREGEGEAAVVWFHLARNLSISVMAGGAPPVCVVQAYPGPAAVLYAIMERLAHRPTGLRVSLERPGVAVRALQLSDPEGLLVETPAGIERREATAEAVQAAVWALLQSAWPREEAAG